MYGFMMININRCAAFLIFMLMLAAPLSVFAQDGGVDAGKTVDEQPAQRQGTRLALHFRAGEALPELAVGLEIMILNALEKSGNISVASMAGMIKACRQANIECGPENAIKIKDIPYLALRADARTLIAGLVDFIDGHLRVDLLSFDGASGKSLSSAMVEGDLFRLDSLVQDISRVIGQLCNVKVDVAVENRADAAHYNALMHLGSAWLNFYGGKNTEALQSLLEARNDGIDVPVFYANDLVEILKPAITESKDGDPELLARYYDLLGETGKAAPEYEKIIGRKPRGVDAYYNMAYMYLRAGKFTELQSVLQKLDKISIEPESIYLKGLMQLKQSKPEYLETWKTLAAKKCECPDVYMSLAAAGGDKKQSAAYALAAAELYSKRFEPLAANEALLESFELSPTFESVVEIRHELLSAAQKERLKKTFESADEHAKKSPAMLLVQARILSETDDIDRVVETYLAADMAAKGNNKLKTEIARYYIKSDLDAFHALAQLTGDSRVLPEDENFLEQLSELFVKADTLDKAEEALQKRLSLKPGSLTYKLDLVDFYEKTRQIDKALELLTTLQEQNPENQAVYRRMARFSLDNNKPDILESALQNLALLDAKSHEAFTAEIKEREKKKNTGTPQVKPEPQKEIVYNFRELAELEKIIPPKPGKSLIIDATGTHDSVVDWLIKLLFSPSRLDTAPVAADIEKIVGSRAEIVDSSVFAGKLDFSNGVHGLTAENLNTAFSGSDAVDAYIFDVSSVPAPGMDMDNYRVSLYLFRKGDPKPLIKMATIEFHQEFLLKFNVFIFLTPLLVILLAALVIMRARFIGKGNLLVKVSFDEHYQRGVFGVRLSRKKLESAFNLDKVLESHRSDMERQMNMEDIARKSFSSISRYIQQVSGNRAVFRNIPAGQYNVYLDGIMVNAKDGSLLGTYELSRQVAIEKDGDHSIEIDLRLTEVYIGIKAVHERIEKYNTVEKQPDGSEKQVVNERIRREALTGVTIEVDGNPAQTKISMAQEFVSYYLSFGTHYFTLTHGDERGFKKVEIKNTAPQEIEIAMWPAVEALQKARTSGDVPADNGSRNTFSTAQVPETASRNSRPASGIAAGSNGKASVAGASTVNETRKSSLVIPPEAIELSDDILRVPDEIVLGETVPAKPEAGIEAASSGFRDIAEILNSDSEAQAVDLFNSEEVLSNEEARKRYIEKGLELMAYKRYVEAAELFIRAGDYGRATEAAQQSGNQNLHYKIYGMNYFSQGQFQEAVEMFKYAEEPLLEADALEGLRMVNEANMKRGEYWRRSGNPTRAIPFFEKAGEFKSAADLYEEMGQFVPAGEAFMKARLYDDAGRNFMKARKIKRAAEAYERAGQFLKAAELFNMVGGKVKVFSLYEKAGRFCEAAEGYKKFGMLDEAIHACQQVRPESHDYLKASLIMGRIFTERGEHDLARTVYSRAISNIREISQENIEPYYEFGVLIQEQGNIHEARQIFERIQTVKYNYADVAIRLQNLQAQVEEDYRRHGTVNPPSTLPSFSGYRTAGSMLTDSQDGAEELPQPENMATPVPASRYVFIEELGRGAMGIVYKARDTVLDRIVAYKTVSSSVSESPTALKYFLSEAKSLAALNHVNIVTIFDVGQDSNGYFITMEYVNGRPLSQFIADKGRLTTKNSVVIASKVCAGLDYAHNNSIIHRDIKPSNIMISEQGEVKIMDFGLARIMDEAVNRKTIAKGTPLYMAPEQVEGVGVDHRADIYSFGVTLFEMCTGTLPFTKGDIAYHHVHTDPPRPSEYNPNIPKVLEKIILRCLEKRKEDRFFSASEIKKELMPLRNALIAGKL